MSVPHCEIRVDRVQTHHRGMYLVVREGCAKGGAQKVFACAEFEPRGDGPFGARRSRAPSRPDLAHT
jgi:hypothetical protein